MGELQEDLSGHIKNGLLLKVYRTLTTVLADKIILCWIISSLDIKEQRQKWHG